MKASSPCLSLTFLFLASWTRSTAAFSPLQSVQDALNFVLISKPELAKRPASRALEFGDYAEVPVEGEDSCPATTTCPIVCVTDVNECTTSCEDGLELCIDGSCSTSCDESIETPCLCEALPVVCAKVVDSYDKCFVRFGTFYDADKECLENEADNIPQVSFTGPWFIFCYLWIVIVTVLTFAWCFFNQKVAPNGHSTQPLAAASKVISSADWTQTGYKTHLIGTAIYYLVCLTLVGIQVLLFVLTIMYYIQQEAITRWNMVFQDELQVLKAFEIVWMVGFVWHFTLKWPESIRSLFYRRCLLEHATHVAVVAPKKMFSVRGEELGRGEQIFAAAVKPFGLFLRFLFSYPYSGELHEVAYCPVQKDPNTGNFSFYHRMRRYIYDTETNVYIPGTLSIGTTFGEFLDQTPGITSDEASRRRGLVGPNIIPMEKPTILNNVIKEFGKAFYLYQNYMVWTWAPYWYYYMAIVQTSVRVTSGFVVAVFQYMSDSVLYKISHIEGQVLVHRDGNTSMIPVTDLVPGDVVVIEPGTIFSDMVIVQAEHLLVDESAMTGEATPIVKKQLDATMKDVTYNPSLHKSHTINAGSIVLETGQNNETLGLVLTTGSFTTKGELLSEVLSYQRHKFKFDDQVKFVVLVLILQACFYLSMVFYFIKDQWQYAWFYGMFVLGTLIPPLLPTVFVVSVGISAKRLQQKKITCTYPEGILVAGKVNAAFFDKTGTLTKQGMDFVGTESCRDDTVMDATIRLGMAVCHDVRQTSQGEFVGNHVDQSAFLATGASLSVAFDRPSVEYLGNSYSVLRNFEFDNHRATQSVVVENGKKRMAFVKGSPESIVALCKAESLPVKFEETLRVGAKSGLYQIAIAFKDYDTAKSLSDITRDDIEKDLTFTGFINFQNVMKEDSPEVMRSLEEGRVSCTMITGDHVLTGIYMARETGMIKQGVQVVLGRMTADEQTVEWVDVDTDQPVDVSSDSFIDTANSVDLAVTGKAWKNLKENDPKFCSTIANRVRVFGRCNPTDKVSVVATFVEQGLKTLMCGDGQNDCGALKAAHVGIALSSNDASVVAPFTSLEKSISSVTEVLREGRCALASAFAAYTYYILYGQIEACLQVINAYLAISFTEWCWVFLDGFWSITMAFSLPLAKAAKSLSSFHPTASLLGPHTVSSVCGLLFWNFFYIVVALLALNAQDWYQCRKWNSEDVSNVLTIGDNYESSVLFIIGGYQYIATAISLNFGYTFRQHWIKNYVFVFFATLWTVFQFVATLYPSNFSCIWRINCDNEDAVRWVTSNVPVAINNPFNTTVFPVKFRWILVILMIANTLTLVLWEYYFVNGYLHRWKPTTTKGGSSETEIEIQSSEA